MLKSAEQRREVPVRTNMHPGLPYRSAPPPCGAAFGGLWLPLAALGWTGLPPHRSAGAALAAASQHPALLAAPSHHVQERSVVDQIQAYFKHDIPEVPYDDEDAFVEVLKKAGLTEG